MHFWMGRKSIPVNRLHQNNATMSITRYDLVEAITHPAGIHPKVEVIRYGDKMTAILTAFCENKSKIC